MTNFAFEMKQVVKLSESGETGTVVGRAEYTNGVPSYLVRYKSADGCHCEAWLPEDALRGAAGARPQPLDL